MRYRIALDPDGSMVSVDLNELPNGTLEATVDGRPLDVDAVSLGPVALSVRSEGRVVDVAAQGSLSHMQVSTRGFRGNVSVETGPLAEVLAQTGRSAVPRASTIHAPMPGRVVRVQETLGARVESGQTLLVLEAMKMENEVRAHRAGTVVAIHVGVGVAVEANAPLVTLE